MRPISIWQPREVDGVTVWVRPEPDPLGDHHSPRRVLHPRPPGHPTRQGAPRRPHRICLFGESAAAGYLYAPHLTAATALERWLRRMKPSHPEQPPSHEVIDLARTNETLAGLETTVEAALQLDPDLLVLFAGNNWTLLETTEVSPYVPSPGDRRRFAEALGQNGLPSAVGLARKTLDGRARATLERIAELASSPASGEDAGIPVVVVVPEVNLADWQSRQPPPWLPAEGPRDWYAALDEARTALDAGNVETAEAAAWRMNRLDGSTSPVPFRLLAEAARVGGNGGSDEADGPTEAWDAALAEVDSVHYPLLCFLDAPRATTAARALLSEAAETHGWDAVDLREMFGHHAGGRLPGRRLFLDYCHLTSEGMAVAMAATAAAVYDRLHEEPGEDAPGWRSLFLDLFLDLDVTDPAAVRELLDLSPEAEATARLGAALHGAHRHLPVIGPVSGREEILEHHCAAALEASPGVAAAMADLAEIRAGQATGAPAVLTEASRRNLESPYPLKLQHGVRWKGLDGDVLRAALAALRRTVETPATKQAIETVERVLRGEPLPAEGLELAWSPTHAWRYLAEPLARVYPEAMDLQDLPGQATLRCPWPETGFHLPLHGSDAAAGACLRLVARLPPIPLPEGEPGTARRGAVIVRVDGREAGRVLLGERWTRATFRVPGGALDPGLHRVTVSWPMPPPVGEAALAAARERLTRGIEADLHPIFGEIFSLRALPEETEFSG